MEALPPLQLNPDVKEYLKESYCNHEATEKDGAETCEKRFDGLLSQLGTPPLYTTIRINLSRQDPKSILANLQQFFAMEYESRGWNVPDLSLHPELKDTVIIKNRGPNKVTKAGTEVIVGLACGMAVLRGSDVFAQGVMGAPHSMDFGDKVSVYADINGKCCKGLTKEFQHPKLFVGNGLAEMSRSELFCAEEPPSGIAIRMTEPLYEAPSLSEALPSLMFAQNLPSILCSHILDPQPGERVLDMCAAPGGKTVHCASLMDNQGEVVAFDKSESKVAKIRENADIWGVDIISEYAFDGTKSVDNTAEKEGSPPYPCESFDRVLLDAPCSALGQRPSTLNKMSINEVKSFPVLQRKLFSKAVELCRREGVLVYSTCTLTLEENEGMVHWALSTFPQLKLVKPGLNLGGTGIPGSGLSDEQLSLVCRFDPSNTGTSPNTDTIGFFCAKFIKSQPSNG